jgi:hypothetical protein
MYAETASSALVNCGSRSATNGRFTSIADHAVSTLYLLKPGIRSS